MFFCPLSWWCPAVCGLIKRRRKKHAASRKGVRVEVLKDLVLKGEGVGSGVGIWRETKTKKVTLHFTWDRGKKERRIIDVN
jgi:hypothetical protein